MRAWQWMLELDRGAFRVALLVLAARCVALARSARKAGHVRPDGAAPRPRPDHLPTVTVQIPLRNEFHVAARVISACAALEYPHDLFEVQVLDDSTDETVGIVDEATRAARQRGVRIAVLRRSTPIRSKAGALFEGLRSATGELVAILDADCVPAPDFLFHAVAPFAGDDTVAAVQGRWSFLNGESSLLAQAQRSVLDGLMAVEQPHLSRRGRVLQFNGSAGVWRASALRDIAAFSAESLAEDLDASARAHLGGFRILHDPTLIVPTELPTTMVAYRAQQRRWAMGNGQNLRAHFGAALRSRRSLALRAGLLFHLARKSIFLLVFLMTITFPLTTFGIVRPAFTYPFWCDALLAAATIASIVAFLSAAARAVGRSISRSIPGSFAAIALSVGLSGTLALAFLNGVLGRRASFERTPKNRAHGHGPVYSVRVDPFVVVEGTLALIYATLSEWSWRRGHGLVAAFSFFVFASFAWTSTASIFRYVQEGRAHRRRRRRPGAARASQMHRG